MLGLGGEGDRQIDWPGYTSQASGSRPRVIQGSGVINGLMMDGLNQWTNDGWIK